MADNVNIIVQDTINDIVVNAAVVVETIDINVQAAVDTVDIVANPNNYVVNINRIIGEQVQSDWTQTDNQAPDYIKNKPTIPAAQVNSDWDATSGVAEILNKPTIPAAVTKTSDLTNDGEDGVHPFITLEDIPPVTGFVPYTGATDDVNLGTHDLTATQGTFATSGNPDTLTVNHSSGSGKALTITKGGAGEGIYVNKTSGSGNAVTIVGDLEATNLKRTGGTSSQFLKADGSVDSNTYTPTTRTISTTAPLSGGGDLSANRTLSITQAATAADGYLSSTDWNTFNGKQDALVSGTNIKTINGASVLGSGDLVVSGSNIYNANGTLTSARTLTSGGFPLTFTGSNTASSAIARGLNLTHTLVAAANNDVLVGLDIQPTFTNGAFTGVNNTPLRISNGTFAGSNSIFLALNRADSTSSFVIGNRGAGWNQTGIWGQGRFFTTTTPDLTFSSGGIIQSNVRFIVDANMQIGTTTDAGFKLDVNGTARFVSDVTGLSFNATTLGGSYKINSINVLDYGNGIRIGYSASVQKITLCTNSGTPQLTVVNSGSILIGTTTEIASSKLTVDSTTQGFLPPRMTATQKNAIATPASGLMVYDNVLNRPCFYDGTTWITL